MVNKEKRNLLKAGGLLTLSALVPTSVHALSKVWHKEAPNYIADGGVFKDGQLQIEITTGNHPTMRVTNTGAELTIVSQLNPGVVQVSGQTLDLNNALAGSRYAIGAGRSRTIPVGVVAEQTVASRDIKKTDKPFKVMAVTANRSQDRLVHANVFMA